MKTKKESKKAEVVVDKRKKEYRKKFAEILNRHKVKYEIQKDGKIICSTFDLVDIILKLEKKK